MFQFKEPATLTVPWILSKNGQDRVIAIPKKILTDLKRHDLLGIDFLFRKYQQQFCGVIINEEEGFNVQLQVAAFFNVMFNNVEQKFLVLVLCPDELILNWHYHLSVHGNVRVVVVGPQTCPQEFDEDHGVALLVSFSNIKLIEHLTGYNYFSIIIDHLDEVVNKLAIRKLQGDFNIGLTCRSFYLYPDQKLHWTMMNWCNPGCVGKLSDFYEVDNDNFANFRDNYRHWWFRLTWNFCDTFHSPSKSDIKVYEEKLLEWAKSNSLNVSTGIGKLTNRSSKAAISQKRNKKSDQYKRQIKKEVVESLTKKPKIEILSPNFNNYEVEDQNSSETTVIDECLGTTPNSSLRLSLSPKKEQLDDFQEHEDEDVLMSIINKTETECSSTINQDTELEYKKQEILSQILDDSSHDVIKDDEESEDFLMSLLETDVKQENGTQGSQSKSKKNSLTLSPHSSSAKSNDIDVILTEADQLFKK